ncbi:hypothetical protein V6N12_042601 [Hibiscus sabdariffa]|uniref:Uncharacterized protein n=1 Tax=Hibiscus sabdariffa TaxID=183260 RepID=A0ABR2EF85_9ROSI
MGGSGLSLIRWDSMQKSIEAGGLGFKDLFLQNKALLLKLGFQLVFGVDKLWVQVLRSKYKVEVGLPITISRSRYSRLWCGLMHIWSDLKESTSWIIRDERAQISSTITGLIQKGD